MNSTNSFSMTCNPNMPNKVAVIKAIRTLTGMDLKRAKDTSECYTQQILQFNIAAASSNPAQIELIKEEEFRILRANGVTVGPAIQSILSDLRTLAKQALDMHEDELANEIFQLVLAEKLRRKS